MMQEDWAPYNPDAVADYMEELKGKTLSELVDETVGWLLKVNDKEWAIRRVMPILREIQLRAQEVD